MTVCHDAASLFQLQWPLKALTPPLGMPVVISPLSTLLTTASIQTPVINISASVRSPQPSQPKCLAGLWRVLLVCCHRKGRERDGRSKLCRFCRYQQGFAFDVTKSTPSTQPVAVLLTAQRGHAPGYGGYIAKPVCSQIHETIYAADTSLTQLRLVERLPPRCVAAQDVATLLGVPPEVPIGSFDALAAYDSPNATLAALGRTVYTVEASLTNLVSLGVAFLFQYGSSPVQLANIMFIVRHPKSAAATLVDDQKSPLPDPPLCFMVPNAPAHACYFGNSLRLTPRMPHVIHVPSAFSP